MAGGFDSVDTEAKAGVISQGGGGEQNRAIKLTLKYSDTEAQKEGGRLGPGEREEEQL